jgi:hypothetical protein
MASPGKNIHAERLTSKRHNRPFTSEGLISVVNYLLSGRLGRTKSLSLSEIHKLVQNNPIYFTASERQIRSAIENLRKMGKLICNDADGDGYYTAGNMQEYQEFRAYYQSYAITILKRLHEMDQGAKDRFNSDARQEKLI